MGSIRWKLVKLPKSIYSRTSCFYHKCRVVFRSFIYNHFMDQSYAVDVCMEPMFWFVDNFTHSIGPFFVITVVCLTVSVVCFAYWIGLPYWWNRNPVVCIILIIIGHWLLINISFHYYMAVITHPGFPPQGELIVEAVSICKKCIAPKPPRTHHCSVCNRCILKMDHHCPWLNNCVGYKNHRYFFLYTIYMVMGVLFIILCGYDLAYTAIWMATEDMELEGHSVKFNKSGALIPVADIMYLDESDPVEDHFNQEIISISQWKRHAIIYMALINTGVLVALGGLATWHSKLIGKGETSIEASINKAESARLQSNGKTYANPYNFGTRKNWRIFLGLVKGRTWFWHVLLPSCHAPIGNGLTWHTIHDQEFNEWP